jgi:DNA-binding CsgD family transcriptional regulator
MRRLVPELIDGTTAGDYLSQRDALQLVELAGLVGFARTDPRAWRMELLSGINSIFHAAASVAIIARDLGQSPSVISMIEVGLKSEEQRAALTREFNAAPFGDPLSRKALERFNAQKLDMLTCLRGELVDDPAWQSDPHVLTYRKGTGMGDCMLSLFRATERGAAFALIVFRAAVSEPPPGSAAPGTDVVSAGRFGPRDRLLLDTLHRGIEGIYRAEESARRVTPAASLPPRLRQTLEFLLTGDTERQVALKMSLSVHTVHDYVKALYAHFGVSSRGALLSKWIGPGGEKRKP